MTHTAVSAPPTPVRPTGRTADWLPSVAAASVSAGAIALGLGAWRDPATSALTRSDGPIAASLLAPEALAATVTVTGLVGLVGVLLGALVGVARPGRRPRGALVALFAVEVVVLGFGLAGVTSIALAGYLVAMALPVLLLVLLVQAVRRYRRVRWAALAAAAAFVTWGLLSAALRPDSLARLGSGLVTGFETAGPRCSSPSSRPQRPRRSGCSCSPRSATPTRGGGSAPPSSGTGPPGPWSRPAARCPTGWSG